MKTIKFDCEDPYEAEKLAGLMSVQKDKTVWVSGVDAAVRNEIVIKLKDRSSHAILLRDEETVERLKSFVIGVVDGRIRIHSSDHVNAVAEITVLD